MLAVYWNHGSPRDAAADEARAIEAAEAVLGDVDAREAQAEHQRQIESDAFDGYNDSLTGLARVWADASQAADVAATQDYADPDGYSLSLVAH